MPADRIEKKILIRAPARLARPDRPRQLGQWFGASCPPGRSPPGELRGPITYPGYEP